MPNTVNFSEVKQSINLGGRYSQLLPCLRMLVFPPRLKNLLIGGYTLTPDGMISFQQAIFPLLLLAFIIVAGSGSSLRPLDLFPTKYTDFPMELSTSSFRPPPSSFKSHCYPSLHAIH
jgi:hypothetical protein